MPKRYCLRFLYSVYFFILLTGLWSYQLLIDHGLSHSLKISTLPGLISFFESMHRHYSFDYFKTLSQLLTHSMKEIRVIVF